MSGPKFDPVTVAWRRFRAPMDGHFREFTAQNGTAAAIMLERSMYEAFKAGHNARIDNIQAGR